MANRERRDSEGQSPQRGDKVLYFEARENLLAGLPISDQDAIRAQVGKEMVVEGFDNFGNVKLEFFEPGESWHSHVIWVEPDCLKKTD